MANIQIETWLLPSEAREVANRTFAYIVLTHAYDYVGYSACVLTGEDEDAKEDSPWNRNLILQARTEVTDGMEWNELIIAQMLADSMPIKEFSK